ncbi:C1 family peptidase [Kitasatospora sp. NPDC085895]|uniref:C1 family peptidase n=1 Tax=Kitasatospora sp. NPDC085895 TaxID=3155057 RepID=UPI00344D31A7
MEAINVKNTVNGKGMGWIPDRPDIRDFTKNTNGIPGLVERTGVLKMAVGNQPESVDLRQFCSPIVDQGELGSCTANAASGVLEYFEIRAHGNFIPASRLFIYKATRDLLQWTGDTGAYLRSTMGAITLFGAPPEKYWPYDIPAFENEPAAFHYAFASNYQALTYYRLDPPGTPANDLLADIKAHAASGIPSMFGFAVYESIRHTANGNIPFPSPSENLLGGHAVMVVGYDNNRAVTNPLDGSTTTGAFIIRNSWGTGWGDSGYGYIPYQYVLQGQADDFWVMVNQEYLETGKFDA